MLELEKSQSPFGSSHDLDERKAIRIGALKGRVTIAFRLESRFGLGDLPAYIKATAIGHNRLSARVTIWTIDPCWLPLVQMDEQSQSPFGSSHDLDEHRTTLERCEDIY